MPGSEKDPLRDALQRELDAFAAGVAGTESGIPADRVEMLNGLAKLIEARDSLRSKPRNWWPALVLGGTLMGVSVLLFARVRETQIELDISVAQLSFALANAQVLSGAADLSTLGVSGLRVVQLPESQSPSGSKIGSTHSLEPVLFLTAATEGQHHGSVTLAPLVLPSNAQVKLACSDVANQFSLSANTKNLKLEAAVYGPVTISLSGSPSHAFDFATPKQIAMQGGSEEVTLDLTFPSLPQSALSPQLEVREIGFTRIDQFLEPNQTLVKHLSTILSGTLFLESLNGQALALRPGEELTFEHSQGEMRGLVMAAHHVDLEIPRQGYRHDRGNGGRTPKHHANLSGVAQGASQSLSVLGDVSLFVRSRHRSVALVWSARLKLPMGLLIPALAMALAVCRSPRGQCSDDLSEQAIDPVVMIGGNLGSTPIFGAGIIFARDKDRLYAVTANHVVRSGGTAASNLTVRLRMAPGKDLSARLLAQFDAGLDLAVLSIDNLAAQGIQVCSLSLDRLPMPGTAKRGDSVYPVGNPNGVPWSMPVRPDAISDVSEGNIVFQSSLIARGHSGGGLINTDGQLVGLIQADEPPFGRAIDIHKILQVLEAWKYPTDLNVHVEGADPPLLVATETGQIEQMKRLLGQVCADSNAESEQFGYRAIELAARRGNVEMVKLLVDAGADLKAKGHDPSVVYSAAIGGNAEVVRLLLSLGAPCCGSALMTAAQEGSVEIVKTLLDSGANPNGLSGGRTAFFYTLVGSMHAGKHTDKEAVLRTLIQAGANVNLPNFDGETPLMTAVEDRETTSVKLLLAAGAKVDARGRGGRSVWDIFTERSGSNDHEIAVVLAGSASTINPEGGAKLLDRAATEGWIDVVDLLIKQGVNVKGKAGASPLMNATLGGRVEIMKLLLEAGTNPDGGPPNHPGATPLQSIVHANEGWGLSDLANDPAVRLEIVKLLISKGAKVRRGKNDRYNDDPLYLTLFEIGDLDVAAILVDHGANVNGENEYGYSYLHSAREISNKKIVAFLLTHGGRDLIDPAYSH